MSFPEPHQLLVQRSRRNIAVALCLVGAIVLTVSLTMVKLSEGTMMEAFQHAPRASALPKDSE